MHASVGAENYEVYLESVQVISPSVSILLETLAVMPMTYSHHNMNSLT